MNWTRRLFVRESLKGWLGLVVGPTLYATARALVGSRSPSRAQPKDIGAAGGLQRGMSKTVLFGNTRVLVVRDAAGRLHAVSAICTHMGCSIRLDADRSEGQLACNCHESKFSLSGENRTGPATRPLTEYRVESAGGRLILSEAEGTSRNL
jgi:Rieske Fe-S protein